MATIAKKSDENIDVLNILSNEAALIEIVNNYLPCLFVSPFGIIAVITVLVVQVNYTILGGLLVLVVAIPIQVLLNMLLTKLRYNHQL